VELRRLSPPPPELSLAAHGDSSLSKFVAFWISAPPSTEDLSLSFPAVWTPVFPPYLSIPRRQDSNGTPSLCCYGRSILPFREEVGAGVHAEWVSSGDLVTVFFFFIFTPAAPFWPFIFPPQKSFVSPAFFNRVLRFAVTRVFFFSHYACDLFTISAQIPFSYLGDFFQTCRLKVVRLGVCFL